MKSFDNNSPDVSQVAKLRQELNEVLQERDRANVLARAEKLAASYAKRQLDVAEVTIAKLQEEITLLKSKPLQEERDRANVLARAEKLAASYAKRQLDVAEVTIAKLQEEITLLKSKPLQEVVDKHC
ncbi:uncharacterized protein A4U43_C09F7880 [Asparagus officinalis]|uniref:Uncharacterized protein n=1 Tax=Asparagus officinalis TaxID=4686 RepID=A0A5P1E9C7_ASPOF|nr:uncharacterized protein A4U43_C09F7880 [Asparagus officinalis]